MHSMPQTRPIRRKAVPEGEEGYILLVAVFLVALVTLSLAIAVPRITKSIQRDRDQETWHRGMQYRRAVQLYYRKFHAYPPNLNALVETSNIRYLRKKYADPLTGQMDWKPIQFGQNKTPTAMGFFGKPLAGNASTIAGVGPGGTSATGTSGSSTSGSFGSIFGSSDTGSSQSGAGGSTTSSGTGTTGGSSSSDTSGSSAFGTTTTGNTTTGGSSSSSSSSSSSGQSFGGLGIIGFAPASPMQSILVVKKKNHYNEWEFTYDPLSDQKLITGGNALGNSSSNAFTSSSSSAFGNNTSFGSSTNSGNSGSGSSSTQNP